MRDLGILSELRMAFWVCERGCHQTAVAQKADRKRKDGRLKRTRERERERRGRGDATQGAEGK